MSSLEQRGTGQFHLVFRFGGRKFKKALKTTQTEVAEAARVRLDENLRLVGAGRLVIPEGADIPTFLLSDGKLNGKPKLETPLTLGRLFEEYLEHLPDGTMESNSLYTAKVHMAHFERVLGKGFSVRGLGLDDLQGYLGRDVSAVAFLSASGFEPDWFGETTARFLRPRTRPLTCWGKQLSTVLGIAFGHAAKSRCLRVFPSC
jgi:hypothetical protein